MIGIKNRNDWIAIYLRCEVDCEVLDSGDIEICRHRVGEKFAAAAFAGRRTKPDWHLCFVSLDEREEKIKSFIHNRRAYKERRAADRKEARTFENPLKVGDLLHYSWGYDQTNCEFYQVVRATDKSVWIRRVCAETVPGSEGFMSASCRPVRDKFLEGYGGEVLGPKPVRPGMGGAVVPMRHGIASKCNEQTEAYSSWYA
jgi:hypothetical protein